MRETVSTILGKKSNAKQRPAAVSVSGRVWDALFDAPGCCVDVSKIEKRPGARAAIRNRLERDFNLDIRTGNGRRPVPWSLVGMFDGARYFDFVVNPRLAARCRGGKE